MHHHFWQSLSISEIIIVDMSKVVELIYYKLRPETDKQEFAVYYKQHILDNSVPLPGMLSVKQTIKGDMYLDIVTLENRDKMYVAQKIFYNNPQAMAILKFLDLAYLDTQFFDVEYEYIEKELVIT